MAKNSKIEWTHHTFNPWWGCTKVSPACKHCYAEGWAKRVGQQVWGGKAARRFFSDNHWREPLRWNREALEAGERRRVFCASMADVFEARRDLNPARERLWGLIEATPNLDWLLLTKRPDQINVTVPWRDLPTNVWVGTTVENDHWAAKRMPALLEVSASIRFLSCEPLLGSLHLDQWLADGGIHWIIAGGESGPNARAMNPEWVRSLRDQCDRHQVAFHFKQWGHWSPDAPQEGNPKAVAFKRDDGEPIKVFALGKSTAGRLLDGRTWDELPNEVE